MKFKVGDQEFEIKDADLQKGLEEKTTVMDLAPDVIVRTKDQDNKFVENMKKDARIEGVEIAVKKTREELGLEFTGKSIKDLSTAISEKAVKEAGLNPDEKVVKLTATLTEKEAALNAAIQRATDAEANTKALKSSFRIEKELDNYIPKNTLLPAEDIKTILKSKLSFRENENGVLESVDSNGNVMKNPTTADLLPMKDVVESFFRDNIHYLKEVEGGAGGGNSKGGGTGGKQTVEEFNKSMTEKGYAINSPEYDKELGDAIVAKTIDV